MPDPGQPGGCPSKDERSIFGHAGCPKETLGIVRGLCLRHGMCTDARLGNPSELRNAYHCCRKGYLFHLGTFKQGVSKQGGSDICVATGITVRCRRDVRCRQCTGKRLSRTIWSSLNKARMSHLCDSTAAGATARRDNVPPPF